MHTSPYAIIIIMKNDNALIYKESETRSLRFLEHPKLLAPVLMVAIVAGLCGYLFGIRSNQNASQSTQKTSVQPSPVATNHSLSTPSPNLTQAIAKNTLNVYIDEINRFSFKYPEAWFFQEVQGWNPPGESINFYLNGVTPNPGGADEPTNAMLNVEISRGSYQTTEQFINTAPRTPGYQRTLNVAGKPAIKTNLARFQQYYIKLSTTRYLILSTYNEELDKDLDAIIASIKFGSE